MQPEISRRCLVCGAAPRAGALFCPQCGNHLTTGDESPRAQPEARAGDGRPAADDPAPEVASEEEVARAFEAWRRAEAGAQAEARPTRPAATEDEALSSAAGEAPRPEPVVGAARAPVAEASRPAAEGGAEEPRAREFVTPGPPMPEPTAQEQQSLTPAQPPPVAEDAGEEDAVGEEAGGEDVGGEEAGAASSSSRPAGAVGATRRRAASVVKESIAPRVERVRDRSIVMLEEAPDDSGLRFVVLAAFLFGLFVLLLVLSTVIK